MGIISDFVVATEAEIHGFVEDSKAPVHAHYAVGGVLSEHVGALVVAAAELAGSDEMLEEDFDAGEDGPWVYRFPAVTTQILGTAPPALRHDLAARWRVIDAQAMHEYGELGSVCGTLIGPICDLASLVGTNHHLFLVVSV
jgi:hypothetical protein